MSDQHPAVANYFKELDEKRRLAWEGLPHEVREHVFIRSGVRDWQKEKWSDFTAEDKRSLIDEARKILVRASFLRTFSTLS